MRRLVFDSLPIVSTVFNTGSWCGQRNTATWIQVAFDRTVDIYGLITQGDYFYIHFYVTWFNLQYGDDELNLMYTMERQNEKVAMISFFLKTVDTIGNCQRLVFTVGVSQHMHKITNL